MPPISVKSSVRWLELARRISLGLIVILAFGWLWLTVGYTAIEPELSSPIKEELRLFFYNQSQHDDPVPGCWYDAGDYLIFASRIGEAAVYLSMAYALTEREDVRADLRQVIDRGVSCLQAMFDWHLKQFRDQDNHGLNIPPRLDELLRPQRAYAYRDGEGKDVALMLSLIERHLDTSPGDVQAVRRQGVSPSEHCCEEGPLVLEVEDLEALEWLALDEPEDNHWSIWGLEFPALAALKSGQTENVAKVLNELEGRFTGSGEPFHYIGGNYDIAGFVALERLYAKQTGDQSFRPLSARLMGYLHGDNAFGVDFTTTTPYHPCSFFRACDLRGTLVNGIDEQGTFDGERGDPWRVAEPQLPGQAIYVLAQVLYNAF